MSAPEHAAGTEAARRRLADAQHALLSALVAGGPPPDGFDERRLTAQRRALLAKRVSVVGKVAPELPGILGAGFRDLFLAYARNRPMTGGYRKDALNFAHHLLLRGAVPDPERRRRLAAWADGHHTPAQPPRGPLHRLAAALRRRHTAH
ncbi:hypothetical protein GCM10010315_53770 [Streptomyces luteosporeus]|uniref:SCO6045-like C-terminal domain-containing protein n=1 Tax=Streptomyces luteosporeus TaxID=173856 RepID=A0ABN3U446_9ACTN